MQLQTPNVHEHFLEYLNYQQLLEAHDSEDLSGKREVKGSGLPTDIF